MPSPRRPRGGHWAIASCTIAQPDIIQRSLPLSFCSYVCVCVCAHTEDSFLLYPSCFLLLYDACISLLLLLLLLLGWSDLARRARPSKNKSIEIYRRIYGGRRGHDSDPNLFIQEDDASGIVRLSILLPPILLYSSSSSSSFFYSLFLFRFFPTGISLSNITSLISL